MNERPNDLYYEGDESIIERLIEAVEDLRAEVADLKSRKPVYVDPPRYA